MKLLLSIIPYFESKCLKPLLDNGNRLGNANEQRGYTPFDYFDIAIDNSVRPIFCRKQINIITVKFYFNVL